MEIKYKVTNNLYSNIKNLLKNYYNMSDRLILKLKKNKRIYKNNCLTHVNDTLLLNDIVKINLDFDEDNDIVKTPIELSILFEDEYLLILNKPPHIPVHPSAYHYDNTLSNGVSYYFDQINLKRKIRPVNRLDKDTSGIVVFAKSEYIQECLIKQMKSNSFKKSYIAILNGILENNSGTINAPIGRKKNSIIERTISPNGDIAITHYRVIEAFNNFSLVSFLLETGRTHQIRVHSQFIGHPILGDSLYGNSSPYINRQALHAEKICFSHPITR